MKKCTTQDLIDLKETLSEIKQIQNSLEKKNLSKKDLYFHYAVACYYYEKAIETLDEQEKAMKYIGTAIDTINSLNDESELFYEAYLVLKDEQHRIKRSKIAKHAAEVRHSKPGAYREKNEEIEKQWKSKKYKSKNECARDLAPKLNLSVKTIREKLKKIN